MIGSRTQDGALGRAANAAVTRLFLKRQATFWATLLVPLWSRHETRAEVVDVVQETPDTKTFWLRPNRQWRGHVAGQHVLLTAEIDGVRTRRFYSIASAPGAPVIALTIKRKDGGLMSSWLHASVGQGDVLVLGPATGDFVLSDATPSKLLFLTAGSGITPAMAIIRDLVGRQSLPDTVFIHHARSKADVIFGGELATIAAAHPQLRLVICTDDAAGSGPFDERRFAALAPDHLMREAWVCGPGPVMDRAASLWPGGYQNPGFHAERFAPSTGLAAPDVATAKVTVNLAVSGRGVTLDTGSPLLDALESAGERPAHGCRIGICHTCKCVKRAGTIENLLTGVVSDATNETIQLCISRPRSDLILAL